MKVIFYAFIFFISGSICSQTPQKIKFQKNSTLIYFFPKESKTDSFISTSNDLFYLVVPDSLKRSIAIYVENGKILRSGNDSIVRLSYLPGLKYESLYVIKETKDPGDKKLKKEFEFISLINGASSYAKNKMLVQIINKNEEKVVIENVYIYKN
ncbi:MAG: hypothetical protein H0W73_01585 [Bacteroidetes bacterium]|nr:hypothetical protein [Bacteroidota bacterium]